MPSTKRRAEGISGGGGATGQIPATASPDTVTSTEARTIASARRNTNGNVNIINTNGANGAAANTDHAAGNGPNNNSAVGTASSSNHEFLREHGLPTLVPVGNLSVEAPVEMRGPVSNAIRIKLTVDTFLTDLYREEHLYLELKDVDDTEAVLRRGVMLCVVPIQPDNFSGSGATLHRMRMSEEGRVRLSDMVVVPKYIAGHVPRWFREKITLKRDARLHFLSDSRRNHRISVDRDRLVWAEDISNYFDIGTTVYVPMRALVRTRPWTMPGDR